MIYNYLYQRVSRRSEIVRYTGEKNCCSHRSIKLRNSVSRYTGEIRHDDNRHPMPLFSCTASPCLSRSTCGRFRLAARRRRHSCGASGGAACRNSGGGFASVIMLLLLLLLAERVEEKPHARA